MVFVLSKYVVFCSEYNVGFFLNKLFFVLSKGPFTIVNIYVFVQSVRRGRGARGQRTNF